MKYINFILLFLLSIFNSNYSQANDLVISELQKGGKIVFIRHSLAPGLNSFYQEKFYKYKDEQIKSLKKYISNWNSEKNLILVTHFVVISEMLNFGTSSGEIVVIDKDYKFIGSIETM